MAAARETDAAFSALARRELLPGASLFLAPDFLAADEADRLLAGLLQTLPWEQHRVRLFGRELPAPRLSCWIGDAGAVYAYSGVRHTPQPWPRPLAALRARLQQTLGLRFNSVLANLYRNGDDAMGWHADDEPELGPEPCIAAVSLGAPRTLRFRSRDRRHAAALVLPHGSLLVMAGPTQTLTQHCLPRSRSVRAPRISLTFRRILPP